MLLSKMVPGILCEGVGSNLQDHLEIYVQQECTKPITLYKAQKPPQMMKIGLEWLLKQTGTSLFSSVLSFYSQDLKKNPVPDFGFRIRQLWRINCTEHPTARSHFSLPVVKADLSSRVSLRVRCHCTLGERGFHPKPCQCHPPRCSVPLPPIHGSRPWACQAQNGSLSSECTMFHSWETVDLLGKCYI